MCSEPVTFGGGITIVNGSRVTALGAAGLERGRLPPTGGDIRASISAGW